jgi:hypothetical protein
LGLEVRESSSFTYFLLDGGHEVAATAQASIGLDLSDYIDRVIGAIAQKLQITERAPKYRWITMAPVDQLTRKR